VSNLNTYGGVPTLKERADKATAAISAHPDCDSIFAIMPDTEDGCDSDGNPSLALVLWLESKAQELVIGARLATISAGQAPTICHLCPSCGVSKPSREVAYAHAGSRGGGYYWTEMRERPCEECRARVSAGGSVGVLDPRTEAH
jgi:hypothetical protein